MEHITDCKIEQDRPTAVTIGNFDGVHMGHRKLIETTKEYAGRENLKSIVLTFKPHPMFIFGNRENNALIMSPEEKEIAIGKWESIHISNIRLTVSSLPCHRRTSPWI